LPRAKGLEASAKLPEFAQKQLQRFEKRFEAESQPDEEYRRWVDLYHPQTSRKQSNDATTMISVPIPTSSSVLRKQQPEALLHHCQKQALKLLHTAMF